MFFTLQAFLCYKLPTSHCAFLTETPSVGQFAFLRQSARLLPLLLLAVVFSAFSISKLPLNTPAVKSGLSSCQPSTLSWSLYHCWCQVFRYFYPAGQCFALSVTLWAIPTQSFNCAEKPHGSFSSSCVWQVGALHIDCSVQRCKLWTILVERFLARDISRFV